MALSSIKEINKFLSIGMSNIYLRKVAIEAGVLKTSIFKFKKLTSRSVFRELQLHSRRYWIL